LAILCRTDSSIPTRENDKFAPVLYVLEISIRGLEGT
jgi:hypothetical protein